MVNFLSQKLKLHTPAVRDLIGHHQTHITACLNCDLYLQSKKKKKKSTISHYDEQVWKSSTILQTSYLKQLKKKKWKRWPSCGFTLTEAQCNTRDFGCALLIWMTLASCITPFSSTLISKGCLKSPTGKSSRRQESTDGKQNHTQTSKSEVSRTQTFAAHFFFFVLLLLLCSACSCAMSHSCWL